MDPTTTLPTHCTSTNTNTYTYTYTATHSHIVSLCLWLCLISSPLNFQPVLAWIDSLSPFPPLSFFLPHSHFLSLYVTLFVMCLLIMLQACAFHKWERVGCSTSSNLAPHFLDNRVAQEKNHFVNYSLQRRQLSSVSLLVW